jgi:hypothetical protein
MFCFWNRHWCPSHCRSLIIVSSGFSFALVSLQKRNQKKAETERSSEMICNLAILHAGWPRIISL